MKQNPPAPETNPLYTPSHLQKTLVLPKGLNFRILLLVVLPLLILIGGGVYYQFYYQKSPVSQKPAPVPLIKPQDQVTVPFAQFNEDKTDINPAIPQYTINTNELVNLKAIEESTKKKLTQEQLQALVEPGFFTIAAPNKLTDPNLQIYFDHGGTLDEFLMNYEDIIGDPKAEFRAPENAVFITSDLMLHTFHVFLDRTFQNIEETQFHPKLLALSTMLYEESLKNIDKSSNASIKESFTRLTAFFLVPKVILETSSASKDTFFQNPEEEEKALSDDENIDKPEKILSRLDSYQNKVPQQAWEKAKAEIELITKADGANISPLFGEFKPGTTEDYTQYKPRSHYQKNSLLRSFWKAMIWFGRNGFLVKSDQLTLDALLQTVLLNTVNKDNQKALTLWENIYLPTVFFVGKSDDLTLYDYQKAIETVYGKQTDISVYADPEKFGKFKAEVQKMANPLIQSSIVAVSSDTTKQEALLSTKGFRLMGQRFIPDSFIFSSLTQGDETPDSETGQKLPAIPTALMPMSIFGSPKAEGYLKEWISVYAPESEKVIAKEKKKLDEAFGKLAVNDWTQNLYWSWLYTLKPLFTKFTQGYPVFMQSNAWDDKGLNTALGSWTELRHDTLLYAKQSYAELGAGGEFPTPPPPPKGYVEPNLTFINRVIALCQMTKDGLEANKVLPEEQKFKIDKMLEIFKFYRDIAVKELQNQNISDEDFEKLRVITSEINFSLIPPSGSFIKSSEARAGLIADVHTAMTQKVQEILYEATGIPQIIFVAVSDINGIRLTRGVVYTYYEFTRPFGERLSDQDWQKVIYENQTTFAVPERPSWAKALEK